MADTSTSDISTATWLSRGQSIQKIRKMTKIIFYCDMQKCLSCTCGYKFRIISPTAIRPTRGLNLDVFPKDITVEGIVKRHIHHNFLMIRGLQVRWWWKGYYLRDKIVSRLTDSFSSCCNISCRATFHSRHNPQCVCSIIFQLRSIMSLPVRRCFCQEYYGAWQKIRTK